MRADLKVIASLVRGGAKGGGHADQLDSFYAAQAEHYDDFRKPLLPGGSTMMQAIPVITDGVWIDIGGGTGANLEGVSEDLSCFRSIYVVDLAKSLLQICQRRIAQNGWTNVTTVCEDAGTFVPPEKKAAWFYVIATNWTKQDSSWHDLLVLAATLAVDNKISGYEDIYAACAHL